MDRPCKKEPGGNKTAQSTKMVLKYLLLVHLAPTINVPQNNHSTPSRHAMPVIF